MVCDTVKPSLRAASCCRVDVVKGGAGVRFSGFLLTDSTVNVASTHCSRNCSTSSWVFRRWASVAFTSVCDPSGLVMAKMPFTL